MKKLLILIFLSSFYFSANASNNQLGLADVVSQFKYSKVNTKKVFDYFHKLLPSTHIDNIYTTPYTGVYVIQAGNNIFYGQVNSPFLLVGHMFNPYSQQDITNDINNLIVSSVKIDLTKIDISTAIIQKGSKNPEHKKIIIFEDPDCPYCRMLETQLQKSGLLEKLDIYKILLALPMHPNSKQHVTNIYCVDQAKQLIILDNYMIKNEDNQIVSISNTCSAEAILEKNSKIARTLDINGTPTIILGNGKLIQGLDLAQIADYATSSSLNKQINKVVKGN